MTASRARRAGPGLLLLGWTGLALAAPALRYETNLVGDPPLVRPSAVAIVPGTREVCVTDEGLRAIAVFDSRGLYRFMTSEAAGLSTPGSASIDAEGDFVCTDGIRGGGRTIRRLNFLGEPVPYEPQSPRQGWSPRHLTIAPDGHYLTVDETGLLAKHDARTGSLIWSVALVEAEWERANQLGRPAVAPDGTIHVANPGLGGVQIVSPDGKLVEWYGERGTKPGAFSFPVAVAFGPEDCVLVLDRMKHKVIVFDSERRFLAEFGGVGFVAGALYHPMGIAATPDGTVLVSQGFEGRVQRFRLEGVVAAQRRMDVSRP